ncbi:MAG: glycine cleavage system protein T [Alphaproteobacteria bacterium RIFCSPLOWO2_01_FULL_40_26]|nr:MAG: glycine cleavage system protein T [Alphaproteobacteria bacterium RIFCSPHIGHO2_02_FULL_40_34]OFW94210.1 MAG: glycine cleavage system protein T [Alphaproteobacteria bacterium RIFCSPLOWO2_01_FULL_40_26]OFX09779.1 MAG: glycine cleavage system protein T [Alphaproteobacteria bacterium RIFCSPLOWO2_02_FULL_40_19]OFX12220.1 MAG: glycine cleavage system protein T [Alphaproteobacteria bacterium RIFCSPLOWO2_12_FULL_40_11]
MKKTALNETHRAQGGKMVEFAGYDMPVQYADGMLKEHEWTRAGNVGIFDVSHMGQFFIEGNDVAKFLSHITPTDFALSTPNLAKYTVLTNPEGGIIDDLIITKLTDTKFFIVLNAACKEKDSAWIRKNLPPEIKFEELVNRSLIALQGGKAEEVLNRFLADKNLASLPYMNIGFYKLKSGEEVFISRTGYTGEDGFEVSIKNSSAAKFWLDLSAQSEVKPVGLGARDSLRLEMGYPLYGHDLDDTTSPIEASLGWVVSKTNTNFIGATRILKEKTEGTKRKRIGVKLLERGIAREGTEIRKDGKKIGVLSSGGFSPNLKISIGQGYFDTSLAKLGDQVSAIVRDREIPAILTSPVFVEAKTKSVKK